MTKLLLFATMGLMLIGSAVSQPKMLKAAMSKYAEATGNAAGGMQFFADEAMTQPIESISDGDFVFYVKAELNKSAAKLCDNYSRAVLELRFDDARDIYDDEIETNQPLYKTAEDPGFVTYKVELLDEEKGDLVDDYFTDIAEKRVYALDLKVFCPGKNQTVSEGKFAIDFSMGNDQYVAAFLSKESDYSFDEKDSFIDDELKNAVKSFYKTVRDTDIVNFAWGERVPYTSDDGRYNIRRHTAGVTYVDLNDQKCYRAGLSVYDDAPYPSTNYKFDGESAQLFNSTQIPCERIGK